jgi:hypothetical protein
MTLLRWCTIGFRCAIFEHQLANPPKNAQNGVTDGAEAHKQLTVLSRNFSNSRQWRFSVAPMMDWTDYILNQRVINLLCRY